MCSFLCRLAYADLSVLMSRKKKVALVACMRELLVILNAMVGAHQPWNPALHFG